MITLFKFWWIILLVIIYSIYGISAIINTIEAVRSKEEITVGTALFYILSLFLSFFASMIYFFVTL